MDKSISNTSNFDSYYNYLNSYNDEENSINQFKDSINHKNENKEILLDIVETGISNHKKEDFIDTYIVEFDDEDDAEDELAYLIELNPNDGWHVERHRW